jgi:hypothetical protein
MKYRLGSKGKTWSLNFDLPDAPRGKATLRLAMAGVSARHIDVSMNDKPAGIIWKVTF